MKKLFFLILFFTTSLLFSQDVLIKDVEGIVRYKLSENKWADITENLKLKTDTIISTGLNSYVVLTIDSKDFTIKSMKNGPIEYLISNNKQGITIGTSAVKSDEAKESSRSNISTASTRASDATEDLEWEE